MFMAQNLRKMCRLVNFDEMFHLFLMLWAESLEALQDSLCGFMLFPFWHLHRLLPPIQWGSTICTVVGVSYMLSAEPELSILPRRLSTFFFEYLQPYFLGQRFTYEGNLTFWGPRRNVDLVSYSSSRCEYNVSCFQGPMHPSGTAASDLH